MDWGSNTLCVSRPIFGVLADTWKERPRMAVRSVAIGVDVIGQTRWHNLSSCSLDEYNLKNVKLSLSMPWRYIGGAEVYIHWFLSSALEGLKSRPGRFTAKVLLFIYFFGKTKISFPLPEFEPRNVQSVALQYEKLVGWYGLHLSFQGTENL
jgi:hypothetical protein